MVSGFGVFGGLIIACAGGGAADGAEGELGFRLCLIRDFGGFGQFDFAKLRGIGEFVDRADAEVFEKQVGRFVKQRAAGKFGATADADQVAVEEFLDHAIACDTADCFDRGFGDRLAVGDDRERFHGGTAEAFRFAAGEELTNEFAELRAGV